MVASPASQSGRIYPGDRKSTRLNSSHRCISYAVFCLKKDVSLQSVDRAAELVELFQPGTGAFANERDPIDRAADRTLRQKVFYPLDLEFNWASPPAIRLGNELRGHRERSEADP